MSLIVTEHAGRLGRAQVAMQPDSAGANGLSLDGTSTYTIVGSGAGPAFVELYAYGSPHYYIVTGGAGGSQYLGEGERVTYGFQKGTVITVTDEEGNGGGGELPGPPYFYFKPSSSGTGDGSSINNAKALNQANLDAAATAMAAIDGTIVLVGPLTSKAQSAARASDEFEPILGGYIVNQDVPIYGIRHPLNPDTSDMAYPCFAGDRFGDWELPEEPDEGEPDPIYDVRLKSVGLQAFDIQADGCHFRYIRFRRTGCCFRWSVDGLGHDALIEDFRADNVQRFVDPYTGAGVANTINDITVRNGTIIGFSKAVIRSAANSSGMLVEDVYGDSGWQAQDSFARLFNCDDTAHNIIVRRCHCLHIYSSLGGYWNGDGFECNDGNEDITFEDCTVNGSTDGGFDTKGKRIQIINCDAEDTKRTIRIWMDTTVIGGTSTDPRNRGDYRNGSCFIFVNGYFASVQVTDPLGGTKASEFRGKAKIYDRHFVGDGDSEDLDLERQATRLVFTGNEGAIARFINCTRTSDLTTGGVQQALTAANAGEVDIAVGSKVSYFSGDPDDINMSIDADLTQSWPEGSLVVVPLQAISDYAGGVDTDVTFELDREHPMVDADETIELSDWAAHNPEVSFIAPPSGGDPVSIDITAEDAGYNHVTDTLVVTSTPQGPTDPPVYAGAGALTSAEELGDTTVTPPLPRSAGDYASDIIVILAHSNITATAPTITGYTLIGSIAQPNPLVKSHLYIRRLTGGEVAPNVVFDTAISVEGEDEGISDTEIHSAQCFLIRYAKTTGTALDSFESFATSVSSTSNRDKTGPTVTTTGGNRLVLNFFVLNKDCPDAAITGGTLTKASFRYTTLGADLTVYAARKTQSTLGAVTGARIQWGFIPETQVNATSQSFGIAFLPKA